MTEVESETKQKGIKLLKWFGKSKKLVFSCVQHNKKEKTTRRSINPSSYSSTVQHTSAPPTSTSSRKTLPFSSLFSNSQLSPSRTSAYSTPSIPTTPTTPTSPFRKTHRHQISRTIETTTTSTTATPAEVAAVSWETPDTDDEDEAFDNIPNKKRRRWGNIGLNISFDHIENTTTRTKTESTINSTSNSIHSEHEERPQQLSEREPSRLLSFSPMMSDGRVWDVKDYRDDGEERDISKQMSGFTPTTESSQIFPYKPLALTNSYPLPTPPLSPDSPLRTSSRTASTTNTYSLFPFSHSRPQTPLNAPPSPPGSPVFPQTPTNQIRSSSHSRTHTPSDSLSSQYTSTPYQSVAFPPLTPITNPSESYHPSSFYVPHSSELSKSHINDVSVWAASTNAALINVIGEIQNLIERLPLNQPMEYMVIDDNVTAREIPTDEEIKEL
ncbi:7768_t:CDS:2 [Paraglomus occultum]|uniref:7768_t:CDS:1 n=1 Tax=Paraglomus occultum TaxID=144539 RepID=A0A9N8W4K0_9GLOM|nr:7768_t:CDS:2 [Paraglomus occultum]